MKTAVFMMCLCLITASLAAQGIQTVDRSRISMSAGVVPDSVSLCGLSVVDNRVIWASGSRGTVALSTDSGHTFSMKQLAGYERCDFRDIEAFDDKRAVIMSIGTPAYILRTDDGGDTWKEAYKNTDTAYFLDAMDFWNERYGVIVGDPVNGRFVVLHTADGGNTWKEDPHAPQAIPGEAVFAASGTSLRCWGRKDFGFVSGGSQSVLYRSKRNAGKWQTVSTGLAGNGMGAFSFCIALQDILFTGGDYRQDRNDSFANFSIVSHPHQLLSFPASGPAGYKSGVELLDEPGNLTRYRVVVTGTSGTQVGTYALGGVHFRFTFGPEMEPFHVVRKAKRGNAVFLAGSRGRIGRLKLK
jgi:photosystem II stability/assembly factor-like uncharacterized protein